MNSIIDKISSNPKSISEEDVVWILPELINHFEHKMHNLAVYAYGINPGEPGGLDIAKRAFRQEASETLEKAFKSYMFKSQYWRSNYNLEAYLTTCLNRLSGSIKRNANAEYLMNAPVCPACKVFNQKEFLRYESKVLRCYECVNSQDKLKDLIKSSSDQIEINRYDYELSLRKIFATHSRKGYGCPSCNRFIPQSYLSGQRVSCPYDNDCDWFGHVDELQSMNHPLGLTSRNLLSLNIGVSKEDGKFELQNLIKSTDVNADVKIQVEQQCNEHVKTLRSVINLQLARIKTGPIHKNIKKILMYEAFLNVLDNHPDDMVAYLVHQNHIDLPIQSRIFQEFIKLVENSLPIEINFNGDIVEIYSLQDPRLDLFLGMSEFYSYIRPDYTIPNNTVEVYIGGRKMKEHGPCFLGQLLDIQLESGESVLNLVDYYTFSQIKMVPEIPVGLKVKVSHFRIPSHYEMNGLVHLQRIRRKIVDSVYQKLNGKKRIVGNSK